MNFSFDASKASQVAGWFLQQQGGRMNIMKLIKLAYLLDRLSLERRGLPVLGGDYFSMKNGPVISEVLDLINAGRLDGMETDWEKFIADRQNHEVEIRQPPGTGQLSEAEQMLMAETQARFGQMDAFQLVKWCHDNCPEWHPLSRGRREIQVEDILSAVGKTPGQIQRIVQREAEFRQLAELLN